MRTINKLEVFEIDGSQPEDSSLNRMRLKTLSHWNRKEFAIIDFEGKSVTVIASELIRAIKNAQNAHV